LLCRDRFTRSWVRSCRATPCYFQNEHASRRDSHATTIDLAGCRSDHHFHRVQLLISYSVRMAQDAFDLLQGAHDDGTPKENPRPKAKPPSKCWPTNCLPTMSRVVQITLHNSAPLICVCRCDDDARLLIEMVNLSDLSSEEAPARIGDLFVARSPLIISKWVPSAAVEVSAAAMREQLIGTRRPTSHSCHPHVSPCLSVFPSTRANLQPQKP